MRNPELKFFRYVARITDLQHSSHLEVISVKVLIRIGRILQFKDFLHCNSLGRTTFSDVPFQKLTKHSHDNWFFRAQLLRKKFIPRAQ